MKISFSENIGNTPAIVLRDTGEVFLKPSIWFGLPEAFRRFIFFHEVGHYELQTTNELEADHFAFHQIAGTAPQSLKNTVQTLYSVLPFHTELQDIRLRNMYRLALTYDHYKKPTAARLAEIRRIEKEISENYRHNEQLRQYIMQTRRGKDTDYEYRGYDPSLFRPSIGNWFRDIPLTQPVTENVPWPTGTPDFMNQYQPATTQTPQQATVSDTTAVVSSVPLSLVPDYVGPFRIDWKTVAIVILVFLAAIGLNRMNSK